MNDVTHLCNLNPGPFHPSMPGEPRTLVQPPGARLLSWIDPPFQYSDQLCLSANQESGNPHSRGPLPHGPRTPALPWPHLGQPDRGPGLIQSTWICTRPRARHTQPHPLPPHPSCPHVIPTGGCLHGTTLKPTLRPTSPRGADSSRVGASLLGDCLLREALPNLQGHGVGPLPPGGQAGLWSGVYLLLFPLN